LPTFLPHATAAAARRHGHAVPRRAAGRLVYFQPYL